MKKQICSILLLLGYSLSLCAADDVFNTACAPDTVLHNRDIEHPAFIPDMYERTGGTGEEPRQWLAYHPKQQPYVAITAAYDPRQAQDKKSVFYRVRELPGCIIVALFEGSWNKKNSELKEVVSKFLDSIDGDAVRSDARCSTDCFGRGIQQHARTFCSEILAQEDKILANGTTKEHAEAFARQWHREPVLMQLIIAAAWANDSKRNQDKNCRLMCWIPDMSPANVNAGFKRNGFIKPLVFGEPRTTEEGELGNTSIFGGVAMPNTPQLSLIVKHQNIINLARVLGEHMQWSSEYAHHVGMIIDLKALKKAAEESISAE